MGLEGLYWIFLNDVSIGIVLIVIKINEVGHSVVLVVWAAFRTVSGIVSLFSALEAGI